MPAKTYALWTDQEVEILKEMAAKGYQADDIIKVLRSRTIEGVSNKANALGLSLSAAPEIDMDAYARAMKGETKCL